MTRMPLKLVLKRIIAAAILTASSTAAAGSKFDIMTGFFSISAKTDQTSGNLSGFGSYRFTYHYRLVDNLDLDAGYSLFLSRGISGDMGYGPDFGFSYYPFTAGGLIRASTKNVTYESMELWRPYVGLSFHQRQFQSVNSAYAGFGGSVGTNYRYSDQIDLKTELRLQTLTGPNKASATETELFFGLGFRPN